MAPHVDVRNASSPLPISPVVNTMSIRIELIPASIPLPSLFMYAQSLASWPIAVFTADRRSPAAALGDPPVTASATLLVTPANRSVTSSTSMLRPVETMKMIVVPTSRRMATRSTRNRTRFAGQFFSNCALKACKFCSSLVSGHAVALIVR